MRKSALVLLLAVTLLFIAAAPSLAWAHWHRWHGWHGHVWVGPGWWGPRPWGWGWPAYYGYAYPPPPYAYPPAPVVVPEPPVYVQPQSVVEPRPMTAQPQSAAPSVPADQSNWYYCPSEKTYYPYVQTCPEAWVTVPARPQ
ncbi:MAG TPA: hypothetical protein VGT40_16920 [Methylomirabilota bacterium]|jgi:hypothetical protein|nr:hypothetical protein [Methylomirabilota bacterium]